MPKENPKQNLDNGRPQWTPHYLRRLLIGEPRDLQDRTVFHTLSLIPFLAWVGLGADGLSSSCYGPEEAFRTLQSHTYLAVVLVLLVVETVSVIATAYSHIIEEFPHGGGGYNVATKLLGEKVGLISGCALLVDYMLTITVSIASAGDQIFSLVPDHWHGLQPHEYKLAIEILVILFLVIINLRGVKESVLILLPIFLVFLVTHVTLVLGVIFHHVPEMPQTLHGIQTDFHHGASTLGLWGMLLLSLKAFSMGGGTYTGLEAVSNGLPIIREPRVMFAKRTMLYMAVSLSFMAGGLTLAYLLVHVEPSGTRTFNAILVEGFAGNGPGGTAFQYVTLLSAGALLVVAALTGFIDGPRVMSNMAIDSWLPRHFASLSDRLTTQNGIMLMGAASLALLIYTHGETRFLVIMYSINVFLTFSISMFGMLKLWLSRRHTHVEWKRRVALFGLGLIQCFTILCVVTLVKFVEGGWITVLVTSVVIALCLMIKRHYRGIGTQVRKFDEILDLIHVNEAKVAPPLDATKRTAAILVGPFGGTGVHLVMAVLRMFPEYQNLVFISVAVIDSGQFKGPEELERQRQMTAESLAKYEELARRLGYAATSRMAVSTDVVDAAENLCREIQKEYPQTTYFAGQIVFQHESWHHRFLHNLTAFQLQKRLLAERRTLVIVPMQV